LAEAALGIVVRDPSAACAAVVAAEALRFAVGAGDGHARGAAGLRGACGLGRCRLWHRCRRRCSVARARGRQGGVDRARGVGSTAAADAPGHARAAREEQRPEGGAARSPARGILGHAAAPEGTQRTEWHRQRAGARCFEAQRRPSDSAARYTACLGFWNDIRRVCQRRVFPVAPCQRYSICELALL